MNNLKVEDIVTIGLDDEKYLVVRIENNGTTYLKRLSDANHIYEASTQNLVRSSL